MQAHGVEAVDCYSVDNALVRPGSPSFIGYCWQRKTDCGEQTLLLSLGYLQRATKGHMEWHASLAVAGQAPNAGILAAGAGVPGVTYVLVCTASPVAPGEWPCDRS